MIKIQFRGAPFRLYEEQRLAEKHQRNATENISDYMTDRMLSSGLQHGQSKTVKRRQNDVKKYISWGRLLDYATEKTHVSDL